MLLISGCVKQDKTFQLNWEINVDLLCLELKTVLSNNSKKKKKKCAQITGIFCVRVWSSGSRDVPAVRARLQLR